VIIVFHIAQKYPRAVVGVPGGGRREIEVWVAGM